MSSHREPQARYRSDAQETVKDLETDLETLPSGPGMYLMRGSSEEILYIGKAIDIRARVSSTSRPTGAATDAFTSPFSFLKFAESTSS